MIRKYTNHGIKHTNRKTKIVSQGREVFNNTLGSKYSFYAPQLSDQECKSLEALIFEQLLIFDTITIGTGRINFALTFLIGRLGINTVEKMIDSGYIKFLLWSLIIVTSPGKKRADDTYDDSSIYGHPPISSGSLIKDDIDPEKNVISSLSHFGLHRERIKSFTKKAVKVYTVPNGMDLSKYSSDLVIDAYQNNNLAHLRLPYEKEATLLNIDERRVLLELGHKVLETAVMAKLSLKSYENYEPYEIVKKNLENIGKAYNISENTSVLFNLSNLPNLQQLYLNERLNFDSVFDIRHLSSAKYYRKWI